MSDQREQLNEMKKFRQLMEDISGKEFIDDYESKVADNNPCMYCDSKDDDCEVCHGKDEMFEGDPDDTDWDAHWAREDGDDERADDLEADAEFARMDADDEVDEGLGSEFRLAEIIGKDGLAELITDLRNGDVEEYGNSYFEKLYFHFLDEYADEIPVGHRTGRPDNPDEYVLDNLERYHEAEIENYIKQDLQANPIGLGEVGEVMHDDYGAAPVYEDETECSRCFGLKHHPSDSSKPCPECNGTGECPKQIDEDAGTILSVLAVLFGSAAVGGLIGTALGSSMNGSMSRYHNRKTLFKTIKQRLNLTPADYAAMKQITSAYNGDPEFRALVDKYMKPDGSYKSPGMSKIQNYVREKGVEDVSRFIEKLRGFRQNNPIEEDGGDDLGIGMNQADLKRVSQKWVVKRDKNPVEYEHRVEEPFRTKLGREYTTTHDSRKEALAQIKAEAQAFLAVFDDPSITHKRGSNVWQGKIPRDYRFGEGSFDQAWVLREIPVKKWVESINLDSIVESVLEEFPGQPKDYEVEYDDPDDLGPIAQSKSQIIKDIGAERGIDVIDMPMSDYEDDFIDSEIEDEELGLRFD